MKTTGKILLSVLILMAAVESSTRADNTQDLNPDQYIGIDQLTPGIRGYGLTVFSGTKIDRFDVEVVSVIRNLGPKRDAILVRCDDDRFRLAKGVMGVSGSPVYFDGKLAGAMAFGWSFSEEPLYGVTPIAEMLKARDFALVRKPDKALGRLGYVNFDRSVYQNLMRPVLLTRQEVLYLAQKAGLVETAHNAGMGSGLVTLPLAISMGGFDSTVLSRLQQWIPGLILSGGITTGSSADLSKVAATEITLQPGAVLTIPLITGDMSGVALGTVTEVAGNQVYGFGHALQGAGASAWPMGTGYIHTFVSRQDMSFKLGQAADIVGVITADEYAAVYGEIGDKPVMIPMNIVVQWPDNRAREEFKVFIAQDEMMDPILAVAVALNALMQKGGLPREYTIHYQITMQFDKAADITFANIAAGDAIRDIFEDILMPLALMLNNPWQQIKLTGMKIMATIDDEENTCDIRSARLDQRTVRPGQMIQVQTVLEPMRQGLFTQELTMQLPQDLPEGKYKVSLGGFDVYRQQLQKAQPQRYMAFDTDDLRRIMQERLEISRNYLYMTIILPQEGLAIENQSLPDLPESKAMMLTDPRRDIYTTSFWPIKTAQVKTDYVIMGKADFDIEVSKD